MLKERESYTATKGVENEGYEFEVGMLAFYCFHLCFNNAINDFKIAIYDDQYHPFDDIVIDISTEVNEKYAIQLKHVKDKLVLNSNHFGKNGKMVLNKYFKYDFAKSNHVVLLTNGVVNEEITVGNCHIKVKTSLSDMEQCLDTSNNEEDHIYEISNEETANKITFYTSQKSRYDIDEEIKAKFKEKFYLNDDNVNGVVQKFKNFFLQWKKGSFKLCKLDKEDIKMKIAEILLCEHIVDYKPQFENCPKKKTLLLQKILNSYNVTVVQDLDKEALSSLCCFEDGKQELVKDGQNLLIHVTENGYKELAIILWRLKKFPLILKVNSDNENLIYELINHVQNEDLSFILVGNISRPPTTPKVFENLIDLQENTYFEETIEEFTLSIQGQKEISLKQLNHCNPRFFKIITMKELLLISKGNFIIGDIEEELPQPYIQRRLITTTLKISSIKQFPNDLFAIKGSEQVLKQKLPKWQFWTFEEFVEKMFLDNSIPSRSIILCEDTAKSFATCLKYEKKNVHCLKVSDSEHLQLIHSKEKSDQLRQFQVFPEDQLQSVLKNNINLVCARPGMGKMTMIKYLRKNSPPGYWTVKVDLQEEQDFQFNFEQNTSFEAKIRDCFKEVRRIIFFFCGIDNLQNDSLIKATERIKQVTKHHFKIWIFSEDHLKDALEKIFEVPSMDIEEFTEEEQQQYIQKRLKDQNVDQGLEKVLQSFKMLKNNDILGAPMHLYMLTEIFINNPKASMEEIFVLTDIYRYFIKTKYHHYLTKVSSDHHNQIIDDGIYYRTEQYKLAAVSCLSPTFLNCSIQCDRNFLEQIGRIGDVVGIIFKIADDRSVIFSQQTYADYFAALWLANNYQKVRNVKDFILREDFKNIFFMFNLEICRKCPAHIAVLYQNYKQLHKCQTMLKEMDSLGRSPLHLACFYGTKLPKLKKFVEEETLFKFNNKEIIKEDTHTKRIWDFLMSNTTVNPCQRDKLFEWNLYDCAFSVLNLYVIENLLKAFPETSTIVLDKLSNLKEDFFTVIYYALKFGYNRLFRLTSEISSFVKALSMENCNAESLLHLAVKCGNYNNVEILLDKGAKANNIASTYNKRSVLHLAVESGHTEIVELLLDRGASADVMDRYRSTPLHTASIKGVYQSAQLLIKYGSDVNFADNFGRTSLQLAATQGHLPVLELLLEHGALVDKCDKLGNSPLSCAQDKNHHNIINVLSRQGATTPTGLTRRLSTNEYDEYTSYQLHWAAYTGLLERVEPLLQDGWNINDVDHLGRTPLYRAVAENHLKIVEMFIDKDADVNIPDSNKVVPLCKAISNCEIAVTNLLLRKDASIDVKDSFGYTPLHWAAMYGNVEIMKLLLSKSPDIDAVDNFGRKPVHCAVENGHFEVVALLEDEESKLLEVARGRSEFLEHYDIVNKASRKSKLTPFEEAVDLGNHSLVRKFLRQGKDLNSTNDYGHTILHRAVIRKHRLITELLLDKGAKLDTLDNCRSSILHWAALTGDAKIVELLIKRNVEINVTDIFGYSPLGVAAMNGHFEALTALLKAGADADFADGCGNSPLDWACKKGYTECVQALLENDDAAKSLQGKNFLDLAKEQRTFLNKVALY